MTERETIRFALPARAQRRRRLFPAINANFYASDGNTPAELLQIGNGDGLGRWQKRIALCCRGERKFERLLFLHQRAFELERAGQHRRAAFFWDECGLQLGRLWRDARSWDALAARLGGGAEAMTAEQLREHFAWELIADTHIAFFNGASSPGDADRAFRHLHWLRDVLLLQPLPDRQNGYLLAAAIRDERRHLQQRRETRAATQAASSYLAIDHTDVALQDEAVNSYVEPFSERIGSDLSGLDGISQACVANHVATLEALQARYPANRLLYASLSDACIALAITQVKNDQTHQALVSARKAELYAPDSGAAKAIRQQTEQHMQQLRAVLAAALQRIATEGSELNAAGHRLRYQAETGFSLLASFERSPDSRRIAQARLAAMATPVLRHAPPQTMPAAPSLAAERTPVVRDRTPFDYWLLSIRDAGTKLLALTAAALIAVTLFSGVRRARIESARDEAYAAVERAARARDPLAVLRESERFAHVSGNQRGADWRDSVVDRLRHEAREMPHRLARNDAYDSFVAAHRADQHAGVIAAAERFLAAVRVQDDDPRQSAVLDGYADAILQTLLSQSARGKPVPESSFATYVALTQTTNSIGSTP
jgi:hypothetical protein